MKFVVVTTCNLAGWKQYGARMVATFEKFWSPTIPLLIYSEDTLPVETCAFPAWLDEFKERHRNNADARGKGNGQYDYSRDCIRFAHKVAAATDAALNVEADVMVWLDADTVTHAPVDESWLQSLIRGGLEAGAYIAWLDREKLYPECGFYMLALNHPANYRTMQSWVDLYTSDIVLNMEQTHDCVSLNRVIRVAEAYGDIKVQSLSGEYGRKTPHPFVNSRLSEKMDHLKGPRKVKGRTPQRERGIKDGNVYWQQ